MSDDKAEKKPRGRPDREGIPSQDRRYPRGNSSYRPERWTPKGSGQEAAAYRCGACGRTVQYPETLYRDGRCSECHGG